LGRSGPGCTRVHLEQRARLSVINNKPNRKHCGQVRGLSGH
jgi:hypothetical protein